MKKEFKQGQRLTMQDIFGKFLEDEFPPKYVFCMFDGQPRSLRLSDLSDYDYVFTGIDQFSNLPELEKA